jgi:hypothetical protein
VLGSVKTYLLKKRLGPPIVLVSGLPRSGTSMMMKMLEAAGLELVLDHVRRADEDNPKGYYEYERVKELDKSADKAWLGEHRGKVIKIISFLLPHLPDDFCYKVIFMRRDLGEIVASQNKMLVRRNETGGGTEDERMIELYRKHLKKIEVQVGSRPNIEWLDLDYRQVLESPAENAARIGKFLERSLDAGRMAAVVDRTLYRNRAGDAPAGTG